MRNVFLLVILAFGAISQCDGYILKYDKRSCLEEAKKHKEKAVSELLFAQDITVYIPNLEKKEYMYALISSAIQSVTIPGMQHKLISVGFSLVAGLGIDFYDNYEEMRRRLANASYHMEMYQFYSLVSLKVSDRGIYRDEGSMEFSKAIDYLTMADMLTVLIEDEYIRNHLSGELTRLRTSLFGCLEHKPGVLPGDILVDLDCFYENVNEIICDLENNNLKDEINQCLFCVIEYVESAIVLWK